MIDFGAVGRFIFQPGGKATEDEGYFQLYSQKNTRFNPLTIPRAMANAAASRISLEFGITGPTYTISTACSSANHAIGQAFWMVRQGAVECAITGGSEETRWNCTRFINRYRRCGWRPGWKG